MTVKEMSHSVIVFLGGIGEINRTLFIPSSIITRKKPDSMFAGWIDIDHLF